MPDAGSPLRIAALAATAGCALSLAACGERPIPSPAQEAHAPIARESELAGAPPAPPEPAAPPEAPPPEAAPPPPPPAPDRGGEVIYDLGPVVPGPGAPRAVTPPPPPEHGRRHYTFGGEHAPAPAPHRMVRPHAAHPRAADHRAHPAPHTAPRATPSASSHPAAVSAPPHAKPAPPAPHVAKPAPKAAAPAPPTHRGHGARTPHAAPKPPAAAERTAEMSALQTALTQAVKTGAVLTASTRAEAGRATDATLTLPAAFAETVRAEATKRGLTDKAASANISAALAGDGYAVTPDAAQSQPLTIGQPVEFHWTVIRQPDGKGPLTAQVRADLLGGGSETLDLGSVSPAAPSGFNLSPKSLGAGLLALIAVVVLGWFARGRSSAKPAAILGAGRRNGDRPFDMEPRRGPDDTKL